MKKWSQYEVNFLIKNFCNMQNSEISNILSRTESSISTKAGKLNLKKSKSHISKMISKRNKMTNRDLNYKNLKKIAKNYRCKSEFQKNDPSAYGVARMKGFLNKICDHMILQSYSVPQLILKNILYKLLKEEIMYNTRKIIKPYELDIYIPKYKLAFEYNGDRWHKNDKINKAEICEKNGIHLITISENSKRYEEDIKNQLIKNINIINKYSKKNINISEIEKTVIDDIFDNIIDKKAIKNLCDKYNNYYLFRRENLSLYNKLLRISKLEEFTSHMTKSNLNTIWNIESIKNEVSKYKYLKDFIKKSQGCYLNVLKNDLKYLLSPLIKKSNLKWNEENIKNEMAKYSNFKDFYRNSRNCYNSIMSRKLNHLLTNFYHGSS